MKIVLAYSGGLDTSVALPWLREHHDAEVIAYCADLGQADDLATVERRAWQAGAADVVIEDLRDTYLRDHVFRALRAGAAYEDRYLMAAPLGRPLIGRRLVEIAHERGATAVAHGSTGKGNDQVRFYAAAVAHDPGIRVIGPAMEWELGSRADELAYARRHGIEVDATDDSPFSMDGSLWGTSTELGPLDDPSWPPDERVFQLTTSPREAPDTPHRLTLEFVAGTPVALDGERLDPVPLVERLNTIAGRHGIGRVDIVENSLLGIKSRAIYESPAGTVLHLAHRELESLVIDRDTLHHKGEVGRRYAELVYYGLWYSPLREALDAFVDVTQARVDGTVDLELYKGTATVLGRRSDNALYSHSLSAHDDRDQFAHHLGEGFSYVWSMPLRLRALTGDPRTPASATTGSVPGMQP
ncbi:argininosuccinate synthase [Salsipaludibacter albus]|uniref:argininosuccinate synthase n=1 Tax=Salsipaludibacter albus TaxID=2849650 RepID=UPI001EE47EB6|nr:argininosuccinate synthase [Salsipaludibacter albus]